MAASQPRHDAARAWTSFDQPLASYQFSICNALQNAKQLRSPPLETNFMSTSIMARLYQLQSVSFRSRPPVHASRTRSKKCSIRSQMTILDFRLSKFGKIISWHCRASGSQRSRVMKKQRGVTQAEKDFDAEVANFNQEARKILDDRSLSMSARRRLISLKGKALLRPSAAGSPSSPTR